MNIRGYYVSASNHFYSPEQKSGEKVCEKYLLKAISLEDQNSENPYLPTWAKNQAYELLIRYYLKNDKPDLANKYFYEAIALHPDDFMLNQVGKKITTH